MRLCSFTDLKNKEVINICDGCRLGFVCDAEIDLDSGRILSLLLPPRGKLFSLSKCDPIRVLWCDIERIGDDVILVKRADVVARCGECACGH